MTRNTLRKRSSGATPARRPAAFPIACLAAGLPLILVLAHPGVYVAMLLFAVTNAVWCTQIVMAVSFLAELLPGTIRAQEMGVASSTNLTAQGIGTGLAGLLAEATSPSLAIAAAGAASTLLALWPVALWIRPADGAKTQESRPTE